MDYIEKVTKDAIEKALAKGVINMPINPASRGYSQEQIRAFYYKTEEETLRLLQEVENGLVEALKNYQPSSDETLQTTAKTIVGAINEVLGKVPSDYEEKITKILSDLELYDNQIDELDQLVGEHYEEVNREIKQSREVEDDHETRITNLENNGVDLSEYQKKTDDTLETTDKTIIGAINEVNQKAGQGGSGESVETDKTLSIENAPADAKAVGEKLEEKLDKFEPQYKNTQVVWVVRKNASGVVDAYGKEISGSLKADVIPITGAGGTLYVGTPKVSNHATNKDYVDDLVKHTHLLTIYLFGFNETFTIKFEHPSATPLSFEELSGDMNLYTRGLNVFMEGLVYWYIVQDFKNNQITLAEPYEADNHITMRLFETEAEADGEHAYIYDYTVV